MKAYFFGYLFVRLARLLAILVILIALVLAGIRCWQTSVLSESLRYQSDDLLSRRLVRVAHQVQATQSLLARGLPSHSIAAQPLPKFSTRIQTVSGFATAAAELGRAEKTGAELKRQVTGRLDDFVSDLCQKLRAHAASLLEPESPKQTSSPSPARTVLPTPSITEPQEQDRLFAKNVDTDALKARSKQLDDTKAYFNFLSSNVENAENKRIIGEAIAEVSAIEQLLAEAASAPTKTSPQLPEASTAASSPVPVSERREPLNAEKVADHLVVLSAVAKHAATDSWALDDAIDQAATVLSAERERCRKAELDQRQVWIGWLIQVISLAAAAAAVAFVVLVAADVTQTLLDTAINTREMVQKLNGR